MAAVYETFDYIHDPKTPCDPSRVMDNKYTTLDSIKDKFVVKGRNYRVYASQDQFLKDLEAMPEAARTFHEVIFAKPQKLRFDIDADYEKLSSVIGYKIDVRDDNSVNNDISDTTDDIDSYLESIMCDVSQDNIDTSNVETIITTTLDTVDKVYKYVFDSVYDAICTAFFIVYSRDLNPADIIVTESHGSCIKSNHIIINGVYVSSYEQAHAFAQRVYSFLPNICRKFLDMSIYKSLQNFRIAGCHKGDMRIKKIITEHTTADTFITNVRGDLLPDQTIVSKTKAPDVTPLHDDDLANVLSLCSQHGLMRHHVHRRTYGSILLFDRIAASYCDICHYEHPLDNSLLIQAAVKDGTITVFKQCRRYNYNTGKNGKHFIILGSFRSVLAQTAAQSEKVIVDHIAAALVAVDTPTTTPTTTPKTTLCFRDWPQHAYAEPTLRPFELVDTLVVHAAMKMGKTKALTEYMTKYFTDTLRPNNIRIISFRQTFSGNIKEKFPDFTLYSDVTGPLAQARVIVQVESLWRLRIGASPPDLLVLDECESIFEQFDSGLLRGNFNECFAKFQYMMRHAKHVVCMDAGLTNRTYRVLAAMREKPDKLYHYNAYANATDDNYYITSDKDRWLGVLYSAVNDGERIACPMSSVAEAKVLESNLRKRYPDKRIKLYSADTLASEKREHFANVDEHWGRLDILIYTPTVSAGVSFEKKHFSKIFGYFTDKSCPVETCVQMIGRIRDVESHDHFIYLSATGNTLPTTPEQVHERLIQQRINLRTQFDETHLAVQTEYAADGSSVIRTTDYYQLYVENTIVKNISKNSFIKWFIHVVSRFGATCHQLTESVYADNTGSELFIDGALNEEITTIQIEHSAARGEINDAACTRVATAPEITGEEFDMIKTNLQSGVDVSIEERAAFDKFRLRRAYDNYRGPIDSKFVAKYDTKPAKFAFRNRQRLRAATHDGKVNLAQIQQEELASHQYMMDYDPLTEVARKYVYDQHRHALGILQLCGWDNLDDPKQIHEVELSHKLQGKEHIIATACVEFELRTPRLTNVTVDKIMSTVSKILNHMYAVRVIRGHSGMFMLACLKFMV